MAEDCFAVYGRSVLRVRLEPTEIFGTGSSVFPALTLQLKLQLLPTQIQSSLVNYTLVRLAGKLHFANDNTHLASFEAPPLAETSDANSREHHLQVDVPLDIRQIKRIEELRDGKDLILRLILSGLVALQGSGEFVRLQEIALQLQVPRSYWIDRALNPWKISDLRLLEINAPTNRQKEIVSAQQKLTKAEQFYRTGDYPQVLTELRNAFDAMLESPQQSPKATLEKMLVNAHPKVREQLQKTFLSFRDLLHLGPHEPSSTPEVPVPISRHDARFALVTAHAIFEYFASDNWPGI
jgi:hypothetical protein